MHSNSWMGCLLVDVGDGTEQRWTMSRCRCNEQRKSPEFALDCRDPFRTGGRHEVFASQRAAVLLHASDQGCTDFASEEVLTLCDESFKCGCQAG
jgi:hypothetical protein